MKHLQKDLISGLAVFLVAIPLCLGIALASGAPMAAGLLGGIIGGLIIGSISSSSVSVSGPAAGLTTIVLAAITEIGSFEAFLVAVILSGVFQLILALMKAGGIASFFPTSVIKGLLTSIGLILIFKQIPHAVGYDKDTEGDFVFFQADNENTFTELLKGLEHIHTGAIIIAGIGVMILVFWNKVLPKKIYEIIPSSLAVVVVAILLNELFSTPQLSHFFIENSHRVQLPEGISLLNADKLLTMPDFSAFSNPLIWKVALTLAAVASLETLLNIEASDKIDTSGHKTPPNRELVAQGVGNMVSGFLGGLPLTSVVVRSTVNINSGAKTKWSAIFHGVYLVVFILIFPGLLSKIPLSALAAILIFTGFKLASYKEFKAFYKKGWDQFLPFVITVVAIFFTNLLQGVGIGLIVAIFFILRSNFKNPFIFIREEYQNRKILKLELAHQVSFFNKAALEATIENVADHSNVLIDGTRTDFLDHDVKETLNSYREFGLTDKNVIFSFTGFDKKHKIKDEINFPYVLNKEMLDKLTPDDVLEILKKGNNRFVNGKSQKKDLLRQVRESSSAQHPTAVILACIDSRSATELIFDQGFGDIVSIRIAGNVVNEDILGSIEFACHVLGTKLLVVLGHTNCGAVKAAWGETPSGNVGPLIEKIKKSIPKCNHHHEYDEKVFALAQENIFNSIEEIKKDSNLTSLLENNTLKIVGAMYNIDSGVVDFYDEEGI
ncbi:MAG: bifunctional SulP family inorganic anion transporter/carbonic anhydrase [Bacteroidia bacterium]